MLRATQQRREARLNTQGFISEKAVRHCAELQKIIAELEQKPISLSSLWPFLRVLHVLSLDLHSSTRQTEAHLKSLLSYTVAEGDAVGSATATWNTLLNLASEAMSEGRSLSRDEIPEELRHRHNVVTGNGRRTLQAAKEHSALIFQGIRAGLGRDFHLARPALTQTVLDELEQSQVVLVSGPSGIGKSVIGKEIANFLSAECFVFGFRAEEFAQPHLDATLHAAQIPAAWNHARCDTRPAGQKIRGD